MRRLPRALPWLLLGALSLLASVALAQTTGGSFGGGDFGGGDSPTRSRDYGGGGGGGHGGDGFLLDLVLIAFRIHPLFGVLVLGVVVVVVLTRAGRSGGGGASPSGSVPLFRPPPSASGRGWMHSDVTQVRIAVDAAARPAMQAALDALMQTVDVRTKAGLLAIVHRVARLLLEHEGAWRLAGETNYHPMSPPQAAGVFNQLSAAGRNALGAADSAEPGGLFFLSLLVAARREIVDFSAHRPEELRRVLTDLLRITEAELVAVEAHWIPLASGAGIAEGALRRLHPDLKPIASDRCAHCGQPCPPGLRRPHCGAPRS